MKADETRRPIGGGGEPCDGDAAGVGREDRVRVGRLRERNPGLALERFVLEDGLDDEVVASSAVGADRGGDAAQDRLRLGLIKLSLLDLARQVAGDSVAALVRQL